MVWARLPGSHDGPLSPVGGSTPEWPPTSDDRARSLGVTYLRLDCWADNAQLRAYYEKLGFGECDAYVDEGWHGIVLQSRV